MRIYFHTHTHIHTHSYTAMTRSALAWLALVLSLICDSCSPVGRSGGVRSSSNTDGSTKNKTPQSQAWECARLELQGRASSSAPIVLPFPCINHTTPEQIGKFVPARGSMHKTKSQRKEEEDVHEVEWKGKVATDQNWGHMMHAQMAAPTEMHTAGLCMGGQQVESG